MMYGYVIDYIQLHWRSYYWPTFNLADMFICVGIVSWLYLDLRRASIDDVPVDAIEEK